MRVCARARACLFVSKTRSTSIAAPRPSIPAGRHPPPSPRPPRPRTSARQIQFICFQSEKYAIRERGGVYVIHARSAFYRSSNLSFFFFLFSDTKKRYARNPGVPEKVILMESCFIYFFFLHRQRPLFFLFYFISFSRF